MSAFWNRVWRGWCIAVFNEDVEPQGVNYSLAASRLDWRNKCETAQARVRDLEQALVDMTMRANAALYRAGDADEP